jgi:hypothetical protein
MIPLGALLINNVYNMIIKNGQKGFVTPILVVTIALLVLGGGAYVYVNQKPVNNTKINFPDIVNNLPTSTTSSGSKSSFQNQDEQNAVRERVRLNSEPVACTMDAKMCPDGSYVGRTGPKCEFVCPDVSKETEPVITSISQTSGPVGVLITISGKNLGGFEGDKNLWIENNLGQKGIILTGGNSLINTDTSVRFVLQNSYCTVDTSYSGLPCPALLNITPGVYNIYAAPWGKISNKVQFTVIGEVADIPPPLGNSTLRISCGMEEIPGCTDPTKNTCTYMTKCNTEGVNSTRSNFYVIVDGTKVKVLVDIETRLRFVMGPNETLQKWADFYPSIQSHLFGGGMPFGATIYGDWIDATTFKANWIKWTIG